MAEMKIDPESRHDVTFLPWAIWIKFGRLVHNGWHANGGNMVEIETGSRILIWRVVVFPNRKYISVVD